MEIDLAQAGLDGGGLSEALRAEVCVVGGGIAGLLLAHRLVLAGVEVTLLEAGGRGRDEFARGDPFDAELQGQAHAGTREGRVCALGGCSITWGGQLLPLPGDAAWPVSAEVLRPYEEQAGQQFGVDALPYDAAEFFRATGMVRPSLATPLSGLTPRLSKFVPFGRRNLAPTIGRSLTESPRAKVVLHAQAVEILAARSGDRVEAVLLRGVGGRVVEARAKQFVLAAGTVETCRLLLASRSVVPGGLGNRHGQVGVNFHDHLTLPAATFTGQARERALEQGRPWVFPAAHGSTVHSLKLERGPTVRGAAGVHAAMAHVTVEEPEDSGLAAVKALLRARQEGTFGRGLSWQARRVPAALLEAGRLGWWARVRHRRYVSSAAAVRLYLNMAQDAPSKSRVMLSEARDGAGMPRAIVEWGVSQAELEGLRGFADAVRRTLAACGMVDGVRWEPALFAPGENSDARLRSVLEDARHAMGGACMGVDPRGSVVDPELRVHGLENLSVASAAVFPDGSAQLPTLTLAALCLRLADRLRNELG